MDMHACGFVFTSFFTLHCIVKTGVNAHSLWSVAPQLLLVLLISIAPAQRSVDCCLPAWSQLLFLASNLLAQVPQGEFCTYWRYMCIYTFTCRLYLYIDNQICCFHISLNEIHNGQTICQISTSALHQYSVRTIYHIPKTYLKSGFSIRQWCTTATNIVETHAYACMHFCLCTLYMTFQTPNREPAIFNQTVMHNCYKNCWNSWYACMRLCFYRLPHPALHYQNRQ